MMPLPAFAAALDRACRLADEISALPLDEIRETLILAPASVAQDDIARLLTLVDALSRARKALNPPSLPGAPYSVLEAELRRQDAARATAGPSVFAQDDGDRFVPGQGVV